MTEGDEGFALAEEAVARRRELVADNRAAELPGLALALSHLADRQAAAGRHEEAVTTGDEAVRLIRKAPVPGSTR
jgi:hypothetical protein